MPRPRAVARKKDDEKSGLVVVGTLAAVLSVGVLFGACKIWHDFRRWRQDIGREQTPWERAMAEAERNRQV